MGLKRLLVAAAQYPITRHASFAAWVEHTSQWIAEAVRNKAQLLVFPEYGAMELVSLLAPEIQKSLPLQIAAIEQFHESFVQHFANEAQKHKVCILAPSFPLHKKGRSDIKPINRAYIAFHDGRIEYQDKQHMTRFEDEEWGISTGGSEYRVFEAWGVKLGVNICFDVEFPFAAWELAKKGVQILLAPSCTDSVTGMNRVHVGARARALENQFYVVVAQTVGHAEWSYAVDTNVGQAAIYSTCDRGLPDDGTLAKGTLNQPQWVYYDLNLDMIEIVRKSGQVFNFKYMSKINL